MALGWVGLEWKLRLELDAGSGELFGPLRCACRGWDGWSWVELGPDLAKIMDFGVPGKPHQFQTTPKSWILAFRRRPQHGPTWQHGPKYGGGRVVNKHLERCIFKSKVVLGSSISKNDNY